MAAAVNGNQMVVATTDKQVQLWQESNQVASWTADETPTTLDVLAGEWVIWGNAQGSVHVTKVTT